MMVNVYAFNSIAYDSFEDAVENNDYKCISRYLEVGSNEYIRVVDALNELHEYFKGEKDSVELIELHMEPFANDIYWNETY